MFELNEDKTAYLIHALPRLNGEPVDGIVVGRIVAYWPTKDEESKGLRSMSHGYIPAMIVALWTQLGVKPVSPCCNIKLFVSGINCKAVDEVLPYAEDSTIGSIHFSEVPAYGCFTWIPKA